VLDRRPVREPGEAAVLLHHGEPLPALVAEEELLVGGGGRQAAGIVTGSASMMSATVTPARALREGRLRDRAARALGEEPAERREPDRVERRLTADDDDEQDAGGHQHHAEADPDARREARGAVAVAGDPPRHGPRDPPASSGKAGTRLNTSRNRFMLTSSEITTSTGVADARPDKRAASQKRVAAGEQDGDRRGHHDDRQRDERAGHRHAELGAGRVRVAFIRITPPNRKRSMPATSMPSRRAASAWPISWRQDRGEERQRRDHRDGVHRGAPRSSVVDRESHRTKMTTKRIRNHE
jgi:hypothetical protein